MTLSLEVLVPPSEYDSQLHRLVHDVMDRTIELASKADKFDLDTADEMDEASDPSEPIVSLIRSQANFTPAEQAEFNLTGYLLNTLMGICIARRAGLYHDTNQEQP
jgi:hypothetical protein